ncbi:MAG TPA: hypothetical protein VE155_06115 [Pseudonocardiaceae bacterium]|nr:hypothetical protein [Pseudonocardiaceae bacterium]
MPHSASFPSGHAASGFAFVVGAVIGASVGEVVGWGLWRLHAVDRACGPARLMGK